ncbi:anaerobic ribonucleoside-triphosphate reductase [bacterium CG_4_10_14_0_2_um_filter_33_32]|nr:MAG: anaerobic ribonucleoside-triphosphate reductase [bacterium CG2_30_33_46]PIR67570.1 MAG: anaerobic ribonucleoside-triphosphate reductase [bacterium CG10_big_fil_rev_8_21_14_0_10_33_18]PIU76444.1 MAG: anaerobic ribonucleoside-triphosphate reductase [bacterium CG06_land_8_20_14_3_00_33_50]PIW81160.1 MAG: anaerobic ribonucleoside-triphosphate reductase [bacterium CG_4_8_14_3_um_filter_33_28]PIY84882.1 MAG: anaerobic ribonucleoside-triphosphate reductase [bacterium CG_4_10_14_0_8_um_filter_3
MTIENRRLFQYLVKEVENTGLPREAIEEIVEIIGKNFEKYKKVSEDQLKMNEILRVVKESNDYKDSTDLHLLVSAPTKGETLNWDRERIKDALIKEAQLSDKEAEDIAFAVERKVLSSGIRTINVSLLRELVDNELFERGYQAKLKKQEVIGISTYNINQLIFSNTKENSNIKSNNPEAVNLGIAETILKQFALKEVFSPEIAEAHMKGSIHLHDLGYPVRAYCSAHSIEYIKKYGLRLDNLSTASTPARFASTLTGHINTFLASMQAYYAGALGLTYVNIFYAPYLEGKTDAELKQEAQYLIFSCSQNAFSRGGQTLFIDFNVHLGIPEYLENVPAIGPKGKYTGKTYKDYEEESQRFLKAMMDVWRDGDSDGKPFPFPKMNLHVDEKSFTDPKQKELLEYACKISSENGTPYFVFDRDKVNLSMCCRLRTNVTDKYVIEHPESMRFCGFQNVTVNLPQAAYRAGRTKRHDVEEVIKEIIKSMDVAAKAHLQKKEFIKKLMEPGRPMAQVGKNAADNRPYVNLDEASYIIGVIGLNECIKYINGRDLHEDEDTLKLGLKVISAMYLRAKELEKEVGFKIVLEETPAESTSLRLAKVDLKEYPESKDYVRGDIESGTVYYTNSVHLTADAPVDIIERIEKQGKFNNLIEAGCITHVFLGEQRPSPASIYALIKRTWENTSSAQIVISPEFTFCQDCNKVSAGYKRTINKPGLVKNVIENENKIWYQCPYCGFESEAFYKGSQDNVSLDDQYIICGDGTDGGCKKIIHQSIAEMMDSGSIKKV